MGLHPSGSGCAPLPGYIFKTSIIKKVINLIIESGKHGDVHLLGEILNYGHILWLPTPTLYYRIHTSQASSNESIYSRHQVLNMMSSFGINLQSKSVIYYKFIREIAFKVQISAIVYLNFNYFIVHLHVL